MSNVTITNNMIAKEALMSLENTTGTMMIANTQYTEEFVSGVGDSIRVRKPVRYIGHDSRTIADEEDTVEQNTTLTVDGWAGVSMHFDAKELTLDIEEFSQRYIQPAMDTIANKVNNFVLNKMTTGLYYAVGTPGTPINSYATLDQAATRLDEMAVPRNASQRFCGLQPKQASGLRVSLNNSFNKAVNTEILKEAAIGHLAGMDLYTDQSIKYHTKGVATGTPLTNGAGQQGSTLVTDGWTAGTTGILKAGDIFTIDGVYAINPEDRGAYSQLMQFVVTADVDSDAAGNASIPVNPAINSDTTSPYRNVSNAIPDGATILVSDSHTKNFAVSRDAILLATPVLSSDSDSYPYQSVMRSKGSGLSLLVTKYSDGRSLTSKYRFDVMMGCQVNGEYGTLVMG